MRKNALSKDFVQIEFFLNLQYLKYIIFKILLLV
jgi:hypothetical protein